MTHSLNCSTDYKTSNFMSNLRPFLIQKMQFSTWIIQEQFKEFLSHWKISQCLRWSS